MRYRDFLFRVHVSCLSVFFFFFFNDTATTEIYTLSLHDALPIYQRREAGGDDARQRAGDGRCGCLFSRRRSASRGRSEEHTSELQSHSDLVCRLLLEKKKKKETTERRQKKQRQQDNTHTKATLHA